MEIKGGLVKKTLYNLPMIGHYPSHHLSRISVNKAS